MTEPNPNTTTSRTVEKTFLAVFPMFLLTFAAFVCLTLTTFSLPFVPSLYFLWSSQAGGVRFGIWGWCLDEGPVCAETLEMGYTWEPEVAIPITKALAFYPVSAIAVFLTLVAFVPILKDRNPRKFRVFAVFAWFAFASTLVAFVLMIAMWSVAEERFKAAGWKVRWGPLPWMSFVSVVLLLIVVLNSWKGTLSILYQTTPDAPEEWTTKAQPHNLDSEKAIVSSEPSTPVSISASPVAIANARSPHPSTAISNALDNADRSQCEGSSRNRQDSLANSKARSSITTEDSPNLDYICSPPRAFRRDSQRQYVQLTPLRTN